MAGGGAFSMVGASSRKKLSSENRSFLFAGRRAHLNATLETVLIAAISTAPVWLGLFIRMSNMPDGDGYWDNTKTLLVEYVGRGQLFIILTSSLASVLWLGIKDIDDAKYISQKIAIIFSVIALVIGFSVFTMDTVHASNKLEYPKTSILLIVSSCSFYLVSVAFYYYLTVLSNKSDAVVVRNISNNSIDDIINGLGGR